jgi:hypothetical protein
MAEYGTELLRRQLNGKVLVQIVLEPRPFSVRMRSEAALLPGTRRSSPLQL